VAIFPFDVDEKSASEIDNTTYSIRDILHYAVVCREFRLDTQCLVTEQGLTDIHPYTYKRGCLPLNDGIS
jgi:hypothetical protein